VGSVVILSDTDNILANDADLLRIGLKNSIVPLLGVGLLLVRRLRQILLMGAALGIIWYILMMLFGMLFGREATKSHDEVSCRFRPRPSGHHVALNALENIQDSSNFLLILVLPLSGIRAIFGVAMRTFAL
jgi:hypothetical protein